MAWRLAGSTSVFRRRLLDWYDAEARDLPWRGAGCTPYRVLVSEAMLQQTQVATVVPYFQRFVAALPSVQHLADADGQLILRLWQGLGYYSRARNLQQAARAIIADHGGQVPRRVEDLLNLPGVGRYTAGAIASIAHGVRAPAVDGNAVRVLCRVNGIRQDPRGPAVKLEIWQIAERLVPARRPGDFNSALMELGATVCTPRRPRCPACPVRASCRAFAAGIQDRIPPARSRAPTPLVQRHVFVIRNRGGQYLIEQRPSRGRWAAMWQFLTRPPGQGPPLIVTPPAPAGRLKHQLTHRRYEYVVFTARSRAAAPSGMRWVGLDELDTFPMPRPHVKIAGNLDAAAAERDVAASNAG